MSDDMSMYPYAYMDSIKKEKLEAAARFQQLQYLRGAIKILLLVAVFFGFCRFILPACPSWDRESLLNCLSCYISKTGMFILCNIIFAFLAADSGMVTAKRCPLPAHREYPTMDPSEPVPVEKELVVSVSLEKEEAGRDDRAIVNREFETALAAGTSGKHEVGRKLEMVPVPPLSEEEKEFTFRISEERRRKWSDQNSDILGSDQKIGLLGDEQRTDISWELVPVPPPMAEEAAEEELWGVMTDEDINKRFEDFISKTRLGWRQESMQLVVV